MEEERAEVKVQEGPEGFTFLKGDRYIFKYSFRAVEDMKVSNRFTHLGQLKGSAGGYMISGDPIYSLTANNNGLNVRFSNKESIDDFYEGMEKHLDWDDATGEWLHVEIDTTFGESMKVRSPGSFHREQCEMQAGADASVASGIYHASHAVVILPTKSIIFAHNALLVSSWRMKILVRYSCYGCTRPRNC